MHYIVATHVFYNGKKEETYGPAHSIFDFLKRKGKKVSFIKHSLAGDCPAVIVLGSHTSRAGHPQGRILPDSFEQNSINFSYTKNITDRKKIYIGVDPINSVTGIFLKFFRLIKKNIYFTADYADKRFDNTLLNFIYHFLDRLCLLFADEAWCVSTRIAQKRESQGVPRKKIILLPNSPDIKADASSVKDHFSGELIIVANLTKAINLRAIFKAVSILKKTYPQTKLTIVGSGPEEQNFIALAKEMDLSKNVVFLGLEPHDEVIKLIKGSALGFALYTNESSWNVYGDSMKAREYAACGVPIVINDIPSTADDVKKYDAGLILKEIDSHKIIRFIERCYKDKNYYQKLCQNALKLGQDFDKDKILSKAVERYER